MDGATSSTLLALPVRPFSSHHHFCSDRPDGSDCDACEGMHACENLTSSCIIFPSDRLNMKELRSEIEIDASAEQVWRVLTNFAAFPQWNPFIRKASGDIRVGTSIEARMQPSGARGMNFRPTVLKVEPNRELRWIGHLWMGGLFDGEHVFTIEPITGTRVRFTQRENFTGLLVPFLSRSLDRDTKRGFEEMNQALKSQAESS